jgi:hypothetical protein
MKRVVQIMDDFIMLHNEAGRGALDSSSQVPRDAILLLLIICSLPTLFMLLELLHDLSGLSCRETVRFGTQPAQLTSNQNQNHRFSELKLELDMFVEELDPERGSI